MIPPSPLVLVFDRDASTRAWYRAAFVSTDYRVAEAADGLEAMGLVTSQLPDLLVTELRRHHHDGLTLCLLTRSTAATADIPVLMVVLDDNPDVEVAARFVGASVLLEEPRSQAAVLAAADRLSAATPRHRVTRRHLHRLLADLRQRASTQPQVATVEEQARQLLTYVTSTLSSIVLANDEARCMAVNTAACQLTGYSESELLDRFIWDLARPDAHARLLWNRFLAAGECVGEFLVVQKDGAEVTIQLCGLTNVAPGLHATVAERESIDA
jgi:PAS domain S-box-containing protein